MDGGANARFVCAVAPSPKRLIVSLAALCGRVLAKAGRYTERSLRKSMSDMEPLKTDVLRWRCDPGVLPFNTTD